MCVEVRIILLGSRGPSLLLIQHVSYCAKVVFVFLFLPLNLFPPLIQISETMFYCRCCTFCSGKAVACGYCGERSQLWQCCLLPTSAPS